MSMQPRGELMSDDFAQTLPAPLRALVEAEYPRFSAAEMARRRAVVEALLAEQDLDHLVFCGLNRAGSAVQWITQWPVTTEAIGVLSPGKPDAMFVQYVNHAPLARRFAEAAELVEWGGKSSIRRDRGDSGEARGADGPHRRDRPDDVRAARRAGGAIRQGDEPQPRLHAAAPGQIGRGARLVPHRRGLERPRHGGPARRRAPGLERARARRPDRAHLCGGRRHQRHPLHRRHVDGDPQMAVPRQFPSTRRVRRATWWWPRSAPRSGIIPARCCAASRSARNRRRSTATCTLRPTPPSTHRRGAAGRRDAGSGDRGLGRDRGGGLHHHRRPAARLWRRLPRRRSSARRAARPARSPKSRSAPARPSSFSPTSSPATARPACRPARWC